MGLQPLPVASVYDICHIIEVPLGPRQKEIRVEHLLLVPPFPVHERRVRVVLHVPEKLVRVGPVPPVVPLGEPGAHAVQMQGGQLPAHVRVVADESAEVRGISGPHGIHQVAVPGYERPVDHPSYDAPSQVGGHVAVRGQLLRVEAEAVYDAFNKKDYEACIAISDSVLARNPDYADAYYNKGISYCNIAILLNDSAAMAVGGRDYEKLRLQSVAAYAQALRPMEIVRALKPEEKSKWAPPLYRIYLNLNMGRQFDEIEEIVKHLK